MRSFSRVALIADDDEFFRIALRTILTSEINFSEIVETSSLNEAIEKLSERQDIALALFDLAMPGMESLASLKAVRDFPLPFLMFVAAPRNPRSNISSMNRSGTVWDNAAMESFFSSLKTERTARKVYRIRGMTPGRTCLITSSASKSLGEGTRRWLFEPRPV